MSEPSSSSRPLDQPSRASFGANMARPQPPFPGLPDCSPLRHAHTSHRKDVDGNRLVSAYSRPRISVSGGSSTSGMSPSMSPGTDNIARLSLLDKHTSANTTPISPSRTPISPLSLNKALPPTPEASPPSNKRRASSPATSYQPVPRDGPAKPCGYERSFTPPPDAARQPLGISDTAASRRLEQAIPSGVPRRNGKTRPTSTPAVAPRNLGQRIGRSVKNIFSRGQVDEDSYERIEDRHWTE